MMRSMDLKGMTKTAAKVILEIATRRSVQFTLTRCSILAALAILSFAMPALAARDHHQRAINLAGEQRMLTQKMSNEILLIALGVNKNANLKNLKATQGLFDNVLRGLRRGSSELGLSSTTKPEILGLLGAVDALWANVNGTIQEIIQIDGVNRGHVKAIAKSNIALLGVMNQTVEAYELNAYGGKFFTINAAAINQSAGQRMRLQKIIKEFLLIVYGHDVAKNRTNLGESILLFDRTLLGLLKGDSKMRLASAPTPEIVSQLKKVRRYWTTILPLIEPAKDGQSVDPNIVSNVIRITAPMLQAMNMVVLLYESL